MAESPTLIKENPLLPAEDFVALRKQGIEHIEKLGSNIWTDYNTSDPGITILEAVCYAITDLAYRTGFEIKDLLAPEKGSEDTWKQLFYTARQILHNSALTVNDYRKLIIDIDGVRNAWIEPSKDYEVPLWVDYNVVEKEKDHDCSCNSTNPNLCYGKLGLQPLTQSEYDKYRAATLTELEKELQAKNVILDKIKSEIEELEKPTYEDPKKESKLKKLKEKRGRIEKKIEQDLALKTILNTKTQVSESKILELNGLYNVMVEYEEDVLEDEDREKIRQQVIERLFNHRNLCEDFLSINAVEYEDVGLGASIELEENADPDEVLAQLFFVVYSYFTPSIPFYTIDQLLEKGFSVDEIFEGPALKNGFLDSTDLDKTDLFKDIRLSDIINEISDIKGIKAVTYLRLPYLGFDFTNSNSKPFFNEWIEYLREERKLARIQPSLSSVVFCKEREFVSYNSGRKEDRRPDRMLKLFKDLKSEQRKYKLNGHEKDFPVPTGENMALEDYFPITESLPMCYGVSERAGLPADASDTRRAQALQLQGYLLFFEQILSDYLVQLNHIKDLFSFDDKVKHTYFTKPLTQIDYLQALLINHANHGADQWQEILNDFSHVLQNITETPKVFAQRRNVFLNHLLARFSEDMSEYEAISRWLTPYKVDQRLIADKTRIVKDGEYYKISTQRGIGFDYTHPEIWDTNNTSGSERRLGRLLGFRDVKRKILAPDILISEPVWEIDPKKKTSFQKLDTNKNPLSIIKLLDPKDKENILLTSVEVKEGCCTETLMMEILAFADNRKNFLFHDEINQRSRKAAGIVGTFWFELWDGPDHESATLLATGKHFDSQEDREKAFQTLQMVLKDINDNEGLHLVEHILLRPKFDEVLDEANNPVNVSFFDICLDSCDLGKGVGQNTETPPYKKKITRIPAEKCFDKLPWILEYFRSNGTEPQSFLFQEVFLDGTTPLSLKFKRYEHLAKRVRELHEYGSEAINYKIVPNGEEEPDKIKYGFILYGVNEKVLAQSSYVFVRRTKTQVKKNETPKPNDIDIEIEKLIRYFSFQMDLYCEEDPCDHNEDPYSFRTTIVLPCWPKRFRNATFQNLVEKTIQSEFPAHVHNRIVWVGIQEMQRFEKAYSDWLQEMAVNEMPVYEKVNPLIEVLKTLQSCGECKDECHTSSETPKG